jgi:tryptophanase
MVIFSCPQTPHICPVPAGCLHKRLKEMHYKTIFEPFRIKTVEPIRLSTETERAAYLEAAHYNTFLLHSDQVMIDLLTDSGTSAMSAAQWAGMMQGDESYAGASSWFRLKTVIQDLTGMEHILPTHQGRAAERILYSHLGGKGKTFVSNTHFDTTRANIEFSGAEAIDCLAEEGNAGYEVDFRGNLDLDALREVIRQRGAANIPAVILTVTNNSSGGQPVSMGNARAVSQICHQAGIRMVLDACRIAENAWFVHHKEEGQQSKTYEQIATEMCALADCVVMSAKKDGLVNMGGFLSMRDDTLAAACGSLLIITEGFSTYGGLSGRDMEALAIGLKEVFDPGYLDYRIKSTGYLGAHLLAMGIAVVSPVGGHAVYIDARKFYPDIPITEYPGQALVCEMYKAGGIRSVEVGSVMFGKYDAEGNLIPAKQDLVRLAIPRRVYTQSHIDYVIEVFGYLLTHREAVRGYHITHETQYLRHFTARFAPA